MGNLAGFCMRALGSGLRPQIEAFFRDNPDEWLTLSDALIKWPGYSAKQIRDACACIKRAGGIVRSDNGIIKTIWTKNAQ